MYTRAPFARFSPPEQAMIVAIRELKIDYILKKKRVLEKGIGAGAGGAGIKRIKKLVKGITGCLTISPNIICFMHEVMFA